MVLRVEDSLDRPLIPLFTARKGHYPRLRRIVGEINEGMIHEKTKRKRAFAQH
jgi:hypothetical protein